MYRARVYDSKLNMLSQKNVDDSRQAIDFAKEIGDKSFHVELCYKTFLNQNLFDVSSRFTKDCVTLNWNETKKMPHNPNNPMYHYK